MFFLEYVLHEAIVFPLPQNTLVISHDAGSILTAVLKNDQCIVNSLIDRLITD